MWKGESESLCGNIEGIVNIYRNYFQKFLNTILNIGLNSIIDKTWKMKLM